MTTHIKTVLSTVVFTAILAGCSSTQQSATSAPAQAASSAPTGSAQPGAVQRDYPTASEEMALKLKYPLFLSYGADSARVTPFFPGASQRPVAVRLAANAAGYTLKAQGDTCAFPVVYQLTANNGTQLAAGQYTGTAALDLAGWSAQDGSAVLTLGMANGAKDNYGCNIVVNKK